MEPRWMCNENPPPRRHHGHTQTDRQIDRVHALGCGTVRRNEWGESSAKDAQMKQPKEDEQGGTIWTTNTAFLPSPPSLPPSLHVQAGRAPGHKTQHTQLTRGAGCRQSLPLLQQGERERDGGRALGVNEMA
mmetsp:Transcript_18539/g.52966  ORF Transcript_18539/g.52966 Transcript_18539/m.52966 type:complete len:132 (-) Transcript_18539:204-599(-)